MKNLNCLRGVLLTIVFCGTAIAESNEFKAGDFSVLSGREFAELWTVDASMEKNVHFDESGKDPLLVITNTEAEQAVNLVGVLHLNPKWTQLRVTVRFRAPEAAAGNEAWHRPRVSLRFTDASSQGVGESDGYPASQPQMETATDEWVEKSVELSVPDGSVYLVIQPGLYFCTGKLEVADIRVEPM